MRAIIDWEAASHPRAPRTAPKSLPLSCNLEAARHCRIFEFLMCKARNLIQISTALLARYQASLLRSTAYSGPHADVLSVPEW